jgi:RNAse (barnase) inhibitor barstar
MPKVLLDGRSWVSRDDFYEALLTALGAPSWHGRNLDALEETLRSGSTNALNPPLEIAISGMESMSGEARTTVHRFNELVNHLRAAHIDISLQLR